MRMRNSLRQHHLINVRRSFVIFFISPDVIFGSDRTYCNYIIETGEGQERRKDFGEEK